MEAFSADILLRDLTQTDDLTACLRRYNSRFWKETVGQALRALHGTRSLSKAELARRSGVSSVYLHQVFAGRRTPSRDRLLSLCIGLNATLVEAQYLLHLAVCAPLCALRRRDAVLIYALSHQLTLSQTEDALRQAGEAPLRDPAPPASCADGKNPVY